MNYYTQETFLTTPIGNNTINFGERKERGSDNILRIPQLIEGVLDDVRLLESGVGYEYMSDKGRLISSCGLESLVHMTQGDKDIYIIDNHNHAFACRWKSHLSGTLPRGSHLIHIDQHSDYAEPTQYIADYVGDRASQDIPQEVIDCYTNEVLDIASFIKPALACGLCSSHDMILSEYSLLNYNVTTVVPSYHDCITIVDIDLDFRAPEMGIEYYYQTIKIVRKILALSHVRCITIATSPTYIHQQRSLEVLHDILA